MHASSADKKTYKALFPDAEDHIEIAAALDTVVDCVGRVQDILTAFDSPTSHKTAQIYALSSAHMHSCYTQVETQRIFCKDCTCYCLHSLGDLYLMITLLLPFAVT